MKTKFKSAIGIRKSAILWAALGLCAFALNSPAQYQPNFHDNLLTNGVASLSNGQTLAVTTRPITLKQGNGLAFLPLQASGSASTASVTYNFQVTADGTNYTTTTPLQISFALNGTTGVRGYTNVPPSFLNNIRKVRLVSIVNGHSNTIYVTNVVVSYSNQ